MKTYAYRHRDFSYYFGCWEDKGHYLWKSGKLGPMCKLLVGTHTDLMWYPFIDGGFLPKERGKYRQGEAWLSHMGDWTFLAMDDFTVDSRVGSHSTFAEYGRHDYEAMLALAREHFPEVFVRLASAGIVVVPGEPFWRPIETLPHDGQTIFAGDDSLPYKAGIFLAQAPHAEQFPAPGPGMVWDGSRGHAEWRKATHWAPEPPLNDGKKGWPAKEEALIQGPPQGTGTVVDITQKTP